MSEPVYHYLDARLQSRPIVVHLVGVGGTGSQVLTGLARLHIALLALGHEHGLDVSVYDADRVSPSNVGRQMYSPADVGQSKAVTLVTRVNAFFNLGWRAFCDRYTGHESHRADVVITCVDTAIARRTIAQNGFFDKTANFRYWLDCGNSRRSGQVFLTQCATSERPKQGVGLPGLWQVLPEIFDTEEPEDDAPSCSLAESLRSQDLFINDHVSRWALHLLWVLLSEGKTDTCGYWINLADGRVAPVSLRSVAVATPTKRKCGVTG